MKALCIGAVCVEQPVILAPMAGVTDLPFRILTKEMGCGLVYSEMVSDQGLVHRNARTMEMLAIDERERPVAMQIFGSDPRHMAHAAAVVQAAGADIIDVNMGCPMPKIVKNGEGSALMREPRLAEEILQAVVKAVTVPVTVKFRIGWDASSINVVDLARRAEQAGVAAVAVHGRTREQFYSGTADWSAIAAVKEAIRIPVIGNGDVRGPEDARRLLETTGCDGVMIGRAAQGNPWIFRRVIRYLATGVLEPEPGVAERVALMLRHLDMLIEYKGAHVAIREMRRHAAWYTKGLRGAAEYRERFNHAQSREDFLTVFTLCAQRCGPS